MPVLGLITMKQVLQCMQCSPSSSAECVHCLLYQVLPQPPWHLNVHTLACDADISEHAGVDDDVGAATGSAEEPNGEYLRQYLQVWTYRLCCT